MSSVHEIEQAIARLSPDELEELYGWIDQHFPQPMDTQFRADLEAGRIDARIHRALADHKAGTTEVL